MEQLAPRHDIIDLLGGFDLFKTAVRAHKYVFTGLTKIIRIIRAVRTHYDLMMTCQQVSCDQSRRIHHKYTEVQTESLVSVFELLCSPELERRSDGF